MWRTSFGVHGGTFLVNAAVAGIKRLAFCYGFNCRVETDSHFLVMKHVTVYLTGDESISERTAKAFENALRDYKYQMGL